jgi:RNA polymerase sigma-70 factor (ECF subfamily)
LIRRSSEYRDKKTEACRALAGPRGDDYDGAMPGAVEAEVSLLDQVAAGDRRAIEACIDRYGALVWSIARQFLANAEDAQEAMQEVFSAIWRNASRYSERFGTERAFVTMIARRRLIERQRRTEREPEETPTVEQAELSGPGDPSELADEAASAAEVLLKMQSEAQRVFRLAITRGLTYGEIADKMGLSVETVKSHIHVGLDRLREGLEQRVSATECGGVA